MIKVLIADDHTIVRQGLRSLLEGAEDVEVVGEAEDGRQAITQAEALQPDIIVMDIAMPGLNGLEATREIRRRFPQIRVLTLTMHRDPQYVFRLLQAGASGYLLKDSAKEALLAAIQAVHRGETFLSPEVSRQVIDAYIQRGEDAVTATVPFDTLTTREREVLQLIAEGYTSRQIAGQLAISVKTVNNHRARIMDKLNIRDIAGLTRFAVQNGLIQTD